MFDFMENTAGAIMTPEYLRLRVGWNAEEALRVVRASGLDSDAIYTLYVVDEASRLVGSLDVHRLLAAEPGVAVEALMRREAAILVRKYDLLGLPVVDQDGVLVGAIGVNSILDVIVDEDSDDFVRMAALLPDAEGGYLRSSPWKLAARRLPWLIVLMLSAILCERLIHGYEDFLFTSGELGVLMISCIPMLMDTGGNAGSQSATAMVRALALGELPLREAGAGAVEGIARGGAVRGGAGAGKLRAAVFSERNAPAQRGGGECGGAFDGGRGRPSGLRAAPARARGARRSGADVRAVDDHVYRRGRAVYPL